MTIIFPKEIRDRFNIEYPELDERKKVFIKKSLSILNSLLNDTYYAHTSKILRSTELFEIVFLNECSYSDYFFEVSKDYLKFLASLEIFLKASFLSFQSNEYYPIELKNKISTIAFLIVKCDLDYYWDKRKRQIKRKIDEGNTTIIKDNIRLIKNPLYIKCLDDLLLVHNIEKKELNDFYNDSLIRIKEVFEGELAHLSLKIRKPDIKQISNKVIGKENIQSIEISINFILNNIHHKTGAGRYEFSEKEYIYWWLEINRFIYLLNK